MGKARRAKRVTSRSRAIGDDSQSMSEQAAERLTEIAASSGVQAMRFAAAVARGMAKGMAGAVRELRRPIGEAVDAARETAQTLGDTAAESVERATERRRGASTTRGAGRRAGSVKRRSA
jgi:hypothetical protein